MPILIIFSFMLIACTSQPNLDICQSGYSKAHRNVTETMKLAVCKRQGLPDCKGYIIDHILPLELGGTNDLDNLQAQTIEDSRSKDKLENDMHRQVCAGITTLKKAQEVFKK